MCATKEVERKNGEDTENLRHRVHTVRAANNGRTEAFGSEVTWRRASMSYTAHKCKRNLLSFKVAKRQFRGPSRKSALETGKKICRGRADVKINKEAVANAQLRIAELHLV